MKEFINKYKNELIIILGGIISICTALIALPDNGSKIACSIIIAIVTAIIEFIKSGISEKAVELLAKAIVIIIEEVGKNKEDNILNSCIDMEDKVEEIKEKLLYE